MGASISLYTTNTLDDRMVEIDNEKMNFYSTQEIASNPLRVEGVDYAKLVECRSYTAGHGMVLEIISNPPVILCPFTANICYGSFYDRDCY